MVTPHNPTTAVFLQHDSHQMGRLRFLFSCSDTCKHLVVSHPAPWRDGWRSCQTVWGQTENVLHLLEKSIGLVFGQQTQTRRGLQDHRRPLPVVLGHCLLGDLQQLPDGVATLHVRQKTTFHNQTETKTHVGQRQVNTTDRSGQWWHHPWEAFFVIAQCLHHMNPTQRKSWWFGDCQTEKFSNAPAD